MRDLGKCLLAFPLVHKLQEEVVLVEVLGVNPGDAGSRGGTYLTKINFSKFCRQFHMVTYVG